MNGSPLTSTTGTVVPVVRGATCQCTAVTKLNTPPSRVGLRVKITGSNFNRKNVEGARRPGGRAGLRPASGGGSCSCSIGHPIALALFPQLFLTAVPGTGVHPPSRGSDHCTGSASAALAVPLPVALALCQWHCLSVSDCLSLALALFLCSILVETQVFAQGSGRHGGTGRNSAVTGTARDIPLAGT